MEKIGKDFIVINECRGDKGIGKTGHWDGVVVKTQILVHVQLVNLIFQFSPILIKDPDEPVSVIHVSDMIEIAFKVLLNLFQFDVSSFKYLLAHRSDSLRTPIMKVIKLKLLNHCVCIILSGDNHSSSAIFCQIYGNNIIISINLLRVK